MKDDGMRSLITLQLPSPTNTLEYVKRLSGFKGLDIDDGYGLVAVSPKRNLYVIRVRGDIDANLLKSLHPEVKGVHGDVRIAPFESQAPNKEE